MFKVVPDQLRISDGWVRCGQCSEIFNASQHLVSGDPSRSTAPPPPSPGPENRAAPSPAAGPVQSERADADTGVATTVAPPIPAAHAPDAPDAAAIATEADPQEPHWAEPDTAVDANDPPAAPFKLPAGYLDDPLLPPTPDPWPEPAVAAADVSFMREGGADSFWKRRPVRLALVVLAVVLTAALVTQFLLHERNRIAQIEPSTRPVLTALCALAGCELGPLRQIESIVIDSSTFGRLRADNYRLGFSLRNTAPVDVAMPAIELSLTDTQDQALIRRVILPAEFGAQAPALAAGSDWSGTLALSVRPAANTDHIAGYRLLAFYP